MSQTPAASSKSYELKTPIKAATQSPGPLVHAAADDSSDTTDISEEVSLITSPLAHVIFNYVNSQ